MIPKLKRNEIRRRVHSRIRQKVHGSAERPRLNVYRSLNHIYAQVINDDQGHHACLGLDRITAKLKTSAATSTRRKQVGTLVAEAGQGSRCIRKVVLSIAAAICITAASRRSRTQRAKQDSTFNLNGKCRLLSGHST